MARDTYVAPGEIDFYDVIQAEIRAINRRRANLNSRHPGGKYARTPLAAEPHGQGDLPVLEAIGLSLSGGGIRSAAFSLGVLQAMNQQDVINRVDYLSTVSGGGYIGAAMTATMSVTQGDFVFGKNTATTGAPPAADVSDTEAVAHIRNYSNYLIPFGLRDVLTALAIIVRGLVANIAIVLPLVLAAAAVTIAFNPTRSALLHSRLLTWLGLPGLPPFPITVWLMVVGLILFFLWALYRSFLSADRLAEFRAGFPTAGAAWLVLIAIALVCEFQPAVIAGMFDAADGLPAATAGQTSPGGLVGALLASSTKALVAFLAPIWVVVQFFSKQLGNIVAASDGGSRWRKLIASVVARLALWVAGLALPLLIWVGYLYLSYWGIANDSRPEPPAVECQQVAGNFSMDVQSGDKSGSLSGKLVGEPCPAKVEPAKPVGDFDHTPGWLAWLAALTGVGWFYFLATLVLFVSSWFLGRNANSLHRLYRDRISKAFLFNPQRRIRDDGVAQSRDYVPLDPFRLTALSPVDAPYHLINATLNVQGSDFANRRGRNADFFLFSCHYVGSVATGYAPTEKLEAVTGDLDLGTAVAVSGAAASSNMGALSIRPLTPTLALLNVRLAYWMRNPRGFRQQPDPWAPHDSPFSFLWDEILARPREDGKYVYLSDGGHIENLGIYELLRRKCRVIVAVDCDKDAEMIFPSFVAVQRYARIDLGIRISMPWQPIAECARAWMGAGAPGWKKPEGGPTKGPHVAIGKIDYGGGEIGYLVYVKPALSGEENDYIHDYARQHGDYPHESTGDQFFSEEQFEVYRALGFHAMFGFLEGDDDVAVHVDPSLPAGSAAAKVFAPVAAPSTAPGAPSPHPVPFNETKIIGGKDDALQPVRDLLGI